MKITTTIDGIPVTVEADDPQVAINVALTMAKALANSPDSDPVDAVAERQLGFPIPDDSDEDSRTR